MKFNKLLMGHSQPIFFFIFAFSALNNKYVHYEILQMNEFDLWTSAMEATTLPSDP